MEMQTPKTFLNLFVNCLFSFNILFLSLYIIYSFSLFKFFLWLYKRVLFHDIMEILTVPLRLKLIYSLVVWLVGSQLWDFFFLVTCENFINIFEPLGVTFHQIWKGEKGGSRFNLSLNLVLFFSFFFFLFLEFGAFEQMGFMDSQVLVSLGLSLLGGLSTSIGALFVVINQTPNLKMLGLLQGFAAGLMLSISFLDLAHNAINSIGFLKGNIWFFGGVIFFAVVANFIPEPTIAPVSDVKSKKKNKEEQGKDMMKKHRRQVLFSGIITAIGISLHNFPEGMAVFLGSMKGLRVGLNLALAIALHNIPEGVAVALPVYFATQSKWQAFKLATLSGLAEPLGVIIVAYLYPNSVSPEILEGLLGAVGGVMAFLTLHEMLPLAFDYAGQKQAVKAVFFGMAFMSASLYFLEISLPAEMGV